MEKKFLPLSISTFPQLVTENFVYVDKTQYVYPLVRHRGAYFLSRPRRFGKSLLISVLKEIFLGNRELFKGYWIYDRIQWEKYPVLHLDFLGVDYKTLGIEKALTNELNRIAGEYEVQCEGDSITERFANLIRKLAREKPIAVLIDEYDKPVIDYIENLETAEKYRDILKNFYSVLKNRQENIKFLFMTGVSRFSRMSVFSDLNHLIDITFRKDYAQLLGYSMAEIQEYFAPYIQEYIQRVPGSAQEDLLKRLKEYYNGYSWDGETFVYNPFSIVNFFACSEFKNFWFSSGTPTFLLRLARTKHIDIKTWEDLRVKEQFFDKFDISNINLNLLLFQTGYLTIKNYDKGIYALSYPNREVEHALLYNLLEEFSGAAQDVSVDNKMMDF